MSSRPAPSTPTSPQPFPPLQTSWPSSTPPPFTLTVLDRLLDECLRVSPPAAGTLVVTRLTEGLQLTGAMLLARSGDQQVHTHPRTTRTAEVQAAVTRRACMLLDAPPVPTPCMEVAAGRPITLLPAWDGRGVQAVLCVGPKRSGRPYNAQEEAMLHILVRDVALLRMTTTGARMAPEENVARHMAGSLEDGVASSNEGFLSPCEAAVLGYLADGLSNKQIAARAGRSIKTIHIHVEHIYEKLGVHSRTQALHVARQRRLLPVDNTL